jgi:undecaprenyl-diphosphatase
MAVAVCIAWSRVYLGLHFPSDMGAGLLLGAVSGWLALTLGERLGLARCFRVEPITQETSEAKAPSPSGGRTAR